MNPTVADTNEAKNQRRIAARAYELWLARAFRNGSPETDWLRAEREIRGKGTVRLKRTTDGVFLRAASGS